MKNFFLNLFLLIFLIIGLIGIVNFSLSLYNLDLFFFLSDKIGPISWDSKVFDLAYLWVSFSGSMFLIATILIQQIQIKNQNTQFNLSRNEVAFSEFFQMVKDAKNKIQYGEGKGEEGLDEFWKNVLRTVKAHYKTNETEITLSDRHFDFFQIAIEGSVFYKSGQYKRYMKLIISLLDFLDETKLKSRFNFVEAFVTENEASLILYSLTFYYKENDKRWTLSNGLFKNCLKNDLLLSPIDLDKFYPSKTNIPFNFYKHKSS